MKSIHLFLEQIRDLRKPGEDKIEVPEGARISSAALDYIREHKLTILYTKADSQTDTIKAVSESRSESVKKEKPVKKQDPLDSAIKESIQGVVDTLGSAAANMDEAALDEVVNRVIARMKELKGIKGGKTTGVSSGSQADKPAEGDDLIICRCEEITQGEIKDAIRNGMRSVHGIRRVTRAGMGLCQGQTCGALVARTLSREAGISPAEIIPATARGPVRPVPLEVFANSKE